MSRVTFSVSYRILKKNYSVARYVRDFDSFVSAARFFISLRGKWNVREADLLKRVAVRVPSPSLISPFSWQVSVDRLYHHVVYIF